MADHHIWNTLRVTRAAAMLQHPPIIPPLGMLLVILAILFVMLHRYSIGAWAWVVAIIIASAGIFLIIAGFGLWATV